MRKYYVRIAKELLTRNDLNEYDRKAYALKVRPLKTQDILSDYDIQSLINILLESDIYAGRNQDQFKQRLVEEYRFHLKDSVIKPL